MLQVVLELTPEPLSAVVGQTLVRALSHRRGVRVGTLGESHIGHARGEIWD